MSKTDDLDSTSRGIWVFPYDPSDSTPEAGPSRPRRRPLSDVYASSLQAYRSAYEEYEDERAEDQLDDLTHWLNHHDELEKARTLFHRLPVAILQNPGKKIPGQLYSILGNQQSTVVGVQGRDIVDVGSGIRAIVGGIIGDGVKSGMTGLDIIEEWWKSQKYSPTIIVHVQDAQVISPLILSEIIYIITLHSKIPFRLLLSVPSTSTFIAGWQLLEPSSIDLTILQGGRGKKNALGAMLETAKAKAKIIVGDGLAEVLKRDEVMFGHGTEGALKSIQWGMLHHSVNSPLATLASNPELSDRYLASVEAILTTDSMGDIGKDLFQLSAESDLAHVTDPSPRISILQALANTTSFTAHVPSQQVNGTDTDLDSRANGVATSPSTPKKRKSVSLQAHEVDGHTSPFGEVHAKGDLSDLEVLYNLWKGAGKQVNLWDWLQGYKNHVTGLNAEDEEEGPEVDLMEEKDNGTAKENGGERKRKHPGEEVDEDRLHATFVRFCEEARMLGMVRARGKAVGRKADEVVKGVTLL